jgi:hypothetical protein
VTSTNDRIGTLPWVARTRGQLSPSERRALIGPLARVLATIALGRGTAALRVNSGRRTFMPPTDLRMPSSVLTVAAEQEAARLLSPVLLNHSYRTYLFAAAVGHVEHVDVDRELLFASAMLHDTGLRPPTPGMDFTFASAQVALEVAEGVGLSSAATQVMRNAIALHNSPDVTVASDGPVAYLLSAGAALDVVGLRAGKLPPALLHLVVAEHPRLAFKREFASAVAAESAAVPRGRTDLLRRFGAFDLTIRLAPFAG